MTTFAASGEPTPDAEAILYLRVSTKEQAERGGEAEGFSIPAQREAGLRKAAQLSATVVAEFVDAGESARSTDRPDLQRMLTCLADHPTVRYVIVHKVDRLARNRVDDVAINLAIQQAGASLVSCTENIDETPSGILLHGIMSFDRGVLQPQPGQRSGQGHEPEGSRRRYTQPGSPGLHQRAQAGRQPRGTHRRTRS
jgi:hypothetical protein